MCNQMVYTRTYIVLIDDMIELYTHIYMNSYHVLNHSLSLIDFLRRESCKYS